MGNFIKIGKGQNEMLINKNDIVSIKRESESFVSICYKTIDETGEHPFRIEVISYAMSDSEYKILVQYLNEN